MDWNGGVGSGPPAQPDFGTPEGGAASIEELNTRAGFELLVPGDSRYELVSSSWKTGEIADFAHLNRRMAEKIIQLRKDAARSRGT